MPTGNSINLALSSGVRPAAAADVALDEARRTGIANPGREAGPRWRANVGWLSPQAGEAAGRFSARPCRSPPVTGGSRQPIAAHRARQASETRNIWIQPKDPRARIADGRRGLLVGIVGGLAEGLLGVGLLGVGLLDAGLLIVALGGHDLGAGLLDVGLLVVALGGLHVGLLQDDGGGIAGIPSASRGAVSNVVLGRDPAYTHRTA